MIQSSACQQWRTDRPGHAGTRADLRQLHHAMGHDQKVLIPVASPAGGRVGRPVGELHKGPAVRKRLLKAVYPAGPIDRLGQGPAIAQQPGIVDTQAFRTETTRWGIGNTRQITIVRQQTAVAPVQPIALPIEKQTTALPAVSFGPEGNRLKPWRARDRCPGASRLAVPARVTGEVDQVVAIGREISTTFVDASDQPLTQGERIGRAVPEVARHLPGGSSPEDNGLRSVPREQDVQPR